MCIISLLTGTKNVCIFEVPWVPHTCELDTHTLCNIHLAVSISISSSNIIFYHADIPFFKILFQIVHFYWLQSPNCVTEHKNTYPFSW